MAQRQALADLTTNSPRIKKAGEFGGLVKVEGGGGRGESGLAGPSPGDAAYGEEGVSPGRSPPRPLLLPADGALLDPYATRTEDEEALCAVCGDGLSEDPNKIVFCDRCDVAVHQRCYGITTIPDGDWLCCPCAEYEETLRSRGMEQAAIRPPRWTLSGPNANQTYGGGSQDVRCCLCPVRHGVFKKTSDQSPNTWCHLVCGLWHAETTVASTPSCLAVSGTGAIKADRFTSPCSVCGLTSGAVVKCNYGHCQAVFHPLCGRRAGYYLAIRPTGSGGGGGRPTYRAYCGKDSAHQRLKDAQAAAQRADGHHLPGGGALPGAAGGEAAAGEAALSAGPSISALRALASKEQDYSLLELVRQEVSASHRLSPYAP